MGEETRGHVVVVGAGPDRGEEHVAHLLVHVAGKEPAGQQHRHEVAEHQEVALLRVLDLDRVQVHVELGREVVVEDRVHVLQVQAPRVGVQLVGLGVGAREVAPALGGSREGGRGAEAGAGPHQPHERRGVHA